MKKKISMRALGKMLGADVRTVAKTMQAAGINANDPKAAQKVLNVEATKLGIKDENLRIKRADADMREHKLALAKRSVIPAEEVKRDLTRYVLALKSKLFTGIRTAVQEGGLASGCNSEQVTTIQERVHQRAADAFEMMSKNQYQ